MFGAGGGVGRHAVSAAAEQGHDVVAAGRSTPEVPTGVRAEAVDVRDGDGVRRVLVGAEAVLWCVGVTKRSGADVGRAALPLLVLAARDVGASRLVAVSGAGVVLPGDVRGLDARLLARLTARLAPDRVLDKQGEHAILAASGLCWTQVRPGRLVDTAGTGRWALVDRAPGLTSKAVAKADVGRAMVALARTREWEHRAPFLVAG